MGSFAVACASSQPAAELHSNTPSANVAAQRALNRCVDLSQQDDWAAARAAAEAGLAHGVLDALVRATLIDCRARAAYHLLDHDAGELLEVAISAWEQQSPAHQTLAILTEYLGKYYAIVGEFRAAETQLRRSIALREKLPGGFHVTRPLFGLFDVLDQTCRVADGGEVLARLEATYPTDRQYSTWYPGLTESYAATLARRRGDLATARALLARVPPHLDGPEVDHSYALSIYAKLTDYARDAGDYRDALRQVELGLARFAAPGDRSATLDLALSYRAAMDPRSVDYERRHFLTYVSAGAELFPTRVLPVEPCRPSSGPEPTGWLFQPGVEVPIEACLQEGSVPPPSGASMMMILRIEEGRGVASGVVGKMVDSALLECVAKRALQLTHPGPHHFNFRTSWYHYESARPATPDATPPRRSGAGSTR